MVFKKVFNVTTTTSSKQFNPEVFSNFKKPGKLVKYARQTYAAILASLGYFISGLARAWSAPAVPSIQGLNSNSTNYPLPQSPLSKELVSWITSLCPLGAMCGGISSSLFLVYFGRKGTLQISSVLFIIAFGILGSTYYSSIIELIMLSRIIMGVAIGLCIPGAQLYVTECVELNVRGTFGSFPATGMAFGIAICYVVGLYLPWHHLSFFCAVIPILYLVGLFFAPETPQWFINKNKEVEAKKSLEWLRGYDDVSVEFETLRFTSSSSSENNKKVEPGDKEKRRIWEKAVLEPFFVALMLLGFQQWSGVNALIFNIVAIFRSAEADISSDLSSILFGMVGFVATFGAGFLNDTAGRRLLLMLSGVFMCVTMALLGFFFHLQTMDATDGFKWIPLTTLMSYMVAYSLGFASIPFMLMGEILPSQFKNSFSGIAAFYNLTNTFLVTKFYSNIETTFGLRGVFWTYSASSFLAVIFVFFCLPETKGKTGAEIEDHYNKKWSKYKSSKSNSTITRL